MQRTSPPPPPTPDSHIYLASADNVGFGCQQVHHFPFALVAPLRAEHHGRLVPRVVPRPLLSRRAGRVRVFVRHGGDGDGGGDGGVGGGVSQGCSVSQGRLRRPRGCQCHICNLAGDDVTGGRDRNRARRCPRVRFPLQLEGCSLLTLTIHKSDFIYISICF